MRIKITLKHLAMFLLCTSIALGLSACGDGSSNSSSSSSSSSSTTTDPNVVTTLVTSVNGLSNIEPCSRNAQCLPSIIAYLAGYSTLKMAQIATPWTDTATNIIDISKIAFVEGSNNATTYAPEGSVFAMTTDPTYTIKGFVIPGARIFKGNGIPSTPMGTFPVQSGTAAYSYYSALPGGTNPATGVTYSSAAAIGIGPYTLESAVPLYPVVSGTYPLNSLIVGITLTGAVWHLEKAPDSSGNLYNPINALPTDQCFGHPYYQQYHYHAYSWKCFPNQGTTGQSPVFGFALDGFPITGPRAADSHMLTNAELDECHGTTSPITMPDGTVVTTYHYVLNREYPYSVGCFRGKVNYAQALGPGLYNTGMKEGVPYLDTAQP